MLAFLQTLPKDAVIGGTPCAIDSVPLFASRSVLFSCEDPSADPAVITSGLKAYYADDGEKLEVFCATSEVDYLVFDERYYELARRWVFFEPYHSALSPYLEGQASFAVLEIPEEKVLFRSGPIFVVPCTSSLFSSES
jgi:hypothetical protein